MQSAASGSPSTFHRAREASRAFSLAFPPAKDDARVFRGRFLCGLVKLRGGLMGTVGIFINLTQANETALRIRALTNWLPSGAVDPTNGIVYGGGAFSTNPQSYAKKAEKLIKDNPGAKLFIATCWPSVDALDQARQALGVSAPILYAGMVTPSSTVIPNQCTGIQSIRYRCSVSELAGSAFADRSEHDESGSCLRRRTSGADQSV